MSQRYFSILTVALFAGVLSSAWAEKADRLKPMNAEADAMRHDDLKQHTLFTGNVIITKGTTLLRAERVEVVQTPDGYQKATLVAAPGKVAFGAPSATGSTSMLRQRQSSLSTTGAPTPCN